MSSTTSVGPRSRFSSAREPASSLLPDKPVVDRLKASGAADHAKAAFVAHVSELPGRDNGRRDIRCLEARSVQQRLG